MPLRLFPVPLRVGTDICSIPRIRKAITRLNSTETQRPLRRLLAKLLTEHERQYFWNRFGSDAPLSNVDAVSKFLAGRFAAKEACRKACTHFDHNSRGFQRIIILPVIIDQSNKHHSARPQGLILDKEYTAADLADTRDTGVGGGVHKLSPLIDVNELDGQLCEVSISHDEDYATAVALVPHDDSEGE
ncbi:holo-acyl-carrier- synthase [Pyrenophora seminiperda CCB06]|uniref:Holo-acyl-carrier-synthase n=1 Tax=Pyrenophora seminiperda CCB06 TaxID=1302712 RepID=A0A3M7LVA4_9PLEO|nr:holo-acyl-carrier- synthase [Pyrenophora seminiperda CCB06]